MVWAQCVGGRVQRCENQQPRLGRAQVSAEERRKLKRKLKKQRQKQRKSGGQGEGPAAAAEVFAKVVVAGGAVASAGISGAIAANFEAADAPFLAAPLEGELDRITVEAAADDDDDGVELRSRVAFVAPWARVYGALGPDHRAAPAPPDALDMARWRCRLAGGAAAAVFAVKGEGRDPGDDRVLARAVAAALGAAAPAGDASAGLGDPTRLSVWAVRFHPSAALAVLGFLERTVPGLHFLSVGGAGVAADPDDPGRKERRGGRRKTDARGSLLDAFRARIRGLDPRPSRSPKKRRPRGGAATPPRLDATVVIPKETRAPRRRDGA